MRSDGTFAKLLAVALFALAAFGFITLMRKDSPPSVAAAPSAAPADPMPTPSRLEDALRNPAEARVLSLRTQHLTAIPEAIGGLPNLVNLMADYNDLVHLPVAIGRLTSLVELDVHKNLLEDLPSSIGGLTSLITLRADENRITALPAEIGNLSKLSRLILTKNRLISLPTSIERLASLTTLAVDDNQLMTLPDVSKLTALVQLFADGNHLSTLPPDVGRLTSLATLYVSRNELSSLPESLRGSPLHAIHIAQNRFNRIPTELLATMPRLESVFCWGNPVPADEAARARAALPRVRFYFTEAENLPR